MTNQKYITPTKESPVFTAHCDAWGYIETGMYKDAEMNNCLVRVFALDYIDSINMLHEWIKKNKEGLLTYGNLNFDIHALNGDVNKSGDYISKKVYSISLSKVKKYIF